MKKFKLRSTIVLGVLGLIIISIPNLIYWIITGKSIFGNAVEMLDEVYEELDRLNSNTINYGG